MAGAVGGAVGAAGAPVRPPAAAVRAPGGAVRALVPGGVAVAGGPVRAPGAAGVPRGAAYYADPTVRPPVICTRCGQAMRVLPQQLVVKCWNCSYHRCVYINCALQYSTQVYIDVEDHFVRQHNSANRGLCERCGQGKTLTGAKQLTHCAVCNAPWCDMCPYQCETDRGIRDHLRRRH